MTSSRFSLTALLLAATMSFGCSRQAEGERCSPDNGNQDCEGDLVCTLASDLRSDDNVDRCCPEGTSSDSRCDLKTGGTSTGNDTDPSGGGGAGGAMSVEEGTTGHGEACRWNSDCELPLLCAPGGTCEFECNADRDCPSGEKCSDEKSCVAE